MGDGRVQVRCHDAAKCVDVLVKQSEDMDRILDANDKRPSLGGCLLGVVQESGG